MNSSEDNFDRKSHRRKKLQEKNFKKKKYDDDYSINKKSKHRIKEHKEDIENEEWEDWDRYYNH